MKNTLKVQRINLLSTTSKVEPVGTAEGFPPVPGSELGTCRCAAVNCAGPQGFTTLPPEPVRGKMKTFFSPTEAALCSSVLQEFIQTESKMIRLELRNMAVSDLHVGERSWWMAGCRHLHIYMQSRSSRA